MISCVFLVFSQVSNWPRVLHVSKWCEELSSRGQVSEIEASSCKWAKTIRNQDFKNQIVSKWIILDIDYNDFQRIFELCPPQVLNLSAEDDTHPHFWQHLRILENFDFLTSSCFKSREVKCHPSTLLIPQEVSTRVLVHPFSKFVLWSSRIQIKNSRHRLELFST